MKTTQENLRILKEIQKDKIAFEKLKAKANWEHYSLLKVIRVYGDPRNWED